MILLDTHVLLWLLTDDGRLGSRTRRTLDARGPAGEVGLSSVSFWAVAVRVQKGRLDFRFDLNAWRVRLLESGLVELPADGGIALRAGLLSGMHGDPADRIIVASALHQGHTLLTADHQILGWSGELDRLDART